MPTGKPEGGYDFGSKRHYRRSVWAFADECLGLVKPAARRRILVIDTSEGQECEFLVRQKGYRPEHIHAVNRNPAELAWLTRRLRDEHGIVGIRTHAGEVFDVLDTLIDDLDAVNLDLTGHVSEDLTAQLTQVRLHADLFVAITVLRGRERLSEFEKALGYVSEGSEDGWRSALTQAEVDYMLTHAADHVDEADRITAKALQKWFEERQASIEQLARCGPGGDGLRHGLDMLRLFTLYLSLRRAGESSMEAAFPVGRRWNRYRSTAGTQTMLWFAQFFVSLAPLDIGSRQQFKRERVRAEKFHTLMRQYDPQRAAMFRLPTKPHAGSGHSSRRADGQDHG